MQAMKMKLRDDKGYEAVQYLASLLAYCFIQVNNFFAFRVLSTYNTDTIFRSHKSELLSHLVTCSYKLFLLSLLEGAVELAK